MVPCSYSSKCPWQSRGLIQSELLGEDVAPRGRMRGSEHKLKYRKFCLYIRKIFLVKVVKHRKRFPR